MLKLIGAVVVLLLVAGPLLVQIGLLDQGGIIREFVDIETKLFVDLVDLFRGLWARHA